MAATCTDVAGLSCLVVLLVRDREFLMERTVEVDKRRRMVLAHYQSVDHPIKPSHASQVVRGETQGSLWTFKSLGNGKTYIEVESQVRTHDDDEDQAARAGREGG